ncbi:hypothetical protein C8Q73DRAFT_836457 [Cubamyces lactineus]|nr:hypothetical protein C8Q73DRAFT_836457 [Cubamyces lactineus]
MFPLNDFNFVACALATVSAAVGYRVSRGRNRGANGPAENERIAGSSRFRFLKFHRRNSTASARAASIPVTEYDGTEASVSECSTPRPVEQENFSDDVEEGSLKRKRSASPEHADVESPPPKRRRSPEAEESKGSLRKDEEIVPQPLPSQDATQAPTMAIADNGETGTKLAQIVPEPEANKCSVKEPSYQPGTSSPTTTAAAEKPATPLNSPAPFWPASNALVAAKPSAAFQAFCGTRSAFASASSGSPLAGPVWSACAGEAAITTSMSESDPLAALTYATSTEVVLTGEEDESAVAEVKGAKVLIKRGERDFCEGILGHVKLLRHKDTGRERILFRREPVLKVSMNVRLHPLVRCSFDESQGLLRVTLKEPIEGSLQEQVVVYALKRGKASRAEFADFAKAVLESARLHEQASA